MKRVKEFYKKHETKILVAGGIVLLVAAVKHRKYVKALEKKAFQYAGKDVISWVPNGNTFALEEVITALTELDATEHLVAYVKKAPGVYSGIHLIK